MVFEKISIILNFLPNDVHRYCVCHGSSRAFDTALRDRVSSATLGNSGLLFPQYPSLIGGRISINSPE